MTPPPWASCSGMPPVAEATTGSPDAIASKRDIGKGSFQMEGQQKISALRSRSRKLDTSPVADQLCIAGPCPL